MDKDGSGVITPADLKGVYNCREHPKYKSGEWTANQVRLYYKCNRILICLNVLLIFQVYREFLGSFQLGEKDEKVKYNSNDLTNKCICTM